MRTPLVSVIMPICNAGRFLSPSIASVLRQSFTDWELIAVDDGSQDDSLQVARSFAAGDPRIHIETLERNAGTATARNAGIEIARGKYLAFLDADDVALPQRLAAQLRSIRDEPPGTLAASAVEVIDEADSVLSVSRFGEMPEDILPTLLFRNVITNSTVLTQRDGFSGFRAGYEPAEDYDAWLRGVREFRMVYSRQPLVRYRMHPGGASARGRECMENARLIIVHETLSRLGAPAADEDVAFHLNIVDGTFAPTQETLDRAERWLLTLAEANSRTNLFEMNALSRVLGREWHSVCNGCWMAPEAAVIRLARSALRVSDCSRILLSLKLRARQWRGKLRAKPL